MHDLPQDVRQHAPLMSIGLVVYNGATHIRAALDSIVNQPYRNIELIVVDGGSTDGTREILQEYAEHIAVLVSEPDRGIYDAMNKVCSLATADWLLFLGCDDVLLDTLGNVASQLKDRDAVYYGDVVKLSDGKVYGGRFPKLRMLKRNICHQAVLYPASAYKRYSYDLKYRWLADWAYNIFLMGIPVRFIYTGVVIARFNDTGGSAFGDAEFEHDKVILVRESFGPLYAVLLALMVFKYRAVKRLRMLTGDSTLK